MSSDHGHLNRVSGPPRGPAADCAAPAFGDLLRRFRHAAGLTQEQLAERAGLSVAGISALERGAKASPQRETVRLLAEALALAPADRQRLAAAVAARPPPNAGAAARTPFPAWAAPQFAPPIGRERELVDLAALLADPACRLLTLVGPGGIGKTRLALQAGTDARAGFADGAAFVALAAVRSADLIAPAIAGALALPLHGGHDPQVHLLGALRRREVLLVLDNFEQLLDGGGATLVAALLRQAPAITILATSRERLNLREERVFAVEGLAVPADDSGPALAASGAVRLFVERARRAEARFALRAADRPHVARICQLVDGMPLGIELAAAWVPVLPCADIAKEIATNLDFLAGAPRDAPARHRNMRAVFDHSWQLLGEHQRAAFRRLAVFRGGFQRSTAEEVAGVALFALAALVGKSFVRRAPDGRYEIHELLRQYGEAHLDRDPDEARRVRDRHCAHYVAFLARREGRLKGHDQRDALQEIDAELENVRAAWHQATEQGAAAAIARAAEGLWLYHAGRGRYWEGEAAFARAVAALEAAPGTASGDAATRERALGMALVGQASCLHRLGAHGRARALLERSVALFRRLDAPRELGFSLNILAAAVHLEGDLVAERGFLRESIALLDAAGDRWCAAYSRNDLGLATYLLGDAEAAARLALESLAAFEELGDRRGIAFALSTLGELAAHRGDYAAAGRLHREALALRRATDDPWGVAYSLHQLGRVARLAGSRAEAEDRFLESLRVSRECKAQPIMLDVLDDLAILYVEAGDRDRALHLLPVALRHPARAQHGRDKGEALRVWLGGESSPLTGVPRPPLSLETVEGVVDALVQAAGPPHNG